MATATRVSQIGEQDAAGLTGGARPELDGKGQLVAPEPDQRQGHPEQRGQAQVRPGAEALVLAGADADTADDQRPESRREGQRPDGAAAISVPSISSPRCSRYQPG